jgi:hypothetical protein
MEEAVWVFFSVVAIMIVIGSVIGMMQYNQADINENFNIRSLEEIRMQCDYVCNSGQGTKLPVTVTLASGSVFYTKNEKICMAFNDKVRCQSCKCSIVDYTLDFNTTFARKALDKHEFTCYLNRNENDIEIECQG